jgi:hypothetical protein
VPPSCVSVADPAATAPGCAGTLSAPPTHTHVDHAVALGRHHHRVIHRGEWEVRIRKADGLPEFIPPSYVVSERKPPRNTLHPRV